LAQSPSLVLTANILGHGFVNTLTMKQDRKLVAWLLPSAGYLHSSVWDSHIELRKNTMTRSVTGPSQWRLGRCPRSGYVGFVVDKMALQRVFFDTAVSCDNSYSIDCSIFNHFPIIRREIFSILTASLNNQLKTNRTMSIPIRTGADKSLAFPIFLFSYLQHNQKDFPWMG
jgi:hypothetical protein